MPLLRTPRFFSSPSNPSSPVVPPISLIRGGCYDENLPDLPDLPLCPGCGVHMQDSDPDLPGFFAKPSPKSSAYHASVRRTSLPVDEPQISNFLKSGQFDEEADKERPENGRDSKPLVCARCHSLRHYGRVKNNKAENLLPDFDFDRMVGPKIVSSGGSRSVVLMVVDAADFDGSFPRRIAKLLSASIEENSSAWKEGKPGNVPRVLIVVTKIDLLPGCLSPTGLEYWVRQRAHEGGAGKITGVHLVSSLRGWGVKDLLDHVQHLVGTRGSVWAVGAQNAGKSTLINAMGKCVGGKINLLTEAPVPGTTIGIVRVEGILSGQMKLFDTPGIIHPYQISTRLNAEEQTLLHLKKEMRPRTYRIKAGHSVHIAGLMRLDVEETTTDTIYLTVWASPLLPLHMGKIEGAAGMIERHFGRQLQPPIGEDRVAHLGQWLRKEFRVRGNSWEVSSVDIAAPGLGWFAVGLKGEAVLGAWTYEGVDLVLRNSLIPSRAKIFEVAGFTVSEIVSVADSAIGKSKQKKRSKRDGLSVEDSSDRSKPLRVLPRMFSFGRCSERGKGRNEGFISDEGEQALKILPFGFAQKSDVS
ncbi:P-loop containing nucleoside triphosphate hydrolases superfamily protein [Wolffia australiana]